MNKVTYEEESINIYGHKFTKEEFDNLVAGFKPPTFDEVVKVWEEAFPNDLIRVNDEATSIEVEVYGVWGSRLWCPVITVVYDGSFNSTLRKHSAKSINAINLTIRYSEAKEKVNE